MADIGVRVPPYATCEETTGGTTCNACGEMKYFRCGNPASMAVWHQRDRRVYYMCTWCGSHNVRNRGGIDVTR